MSHGFTFPPPPPPPPRSVNPPSRFNSGDRGRGRGSTRARGRGSGPQSHRGAAFRRSADWDRPQQNQTGQPTRPYFYNSQNFASRNGQKRDHSQAFNESQRVTPLGTAPPPVPSFGFQLPIPTAAPPPTQDKVAVKAEKKKERTFNQLGLTPRKEEHEFSEEEDDADEESRLAAAISQPGQGGLRFEHNGQVMSLNTPQEIAAWIKERKRLFPTKARIAEVLKIRAKEREESQRAQAGQRRRRQEESASHRQSTGERSRIKSKTNGKRRENKDPDLAAKFERSQQSKDGELRRQVVDDETDTSEDTSSDENSDAESTSSSGSSDGSGSSDEAPAEQSSKTPVPAMEAPKANSRRTSGLGRACPSMIKSGKCSEGDRCRYRHDILSDEFWKAMDGHQSKPKASTQMSLYERLLRQQNDQEDREILQCIILLGDRGLLAEPGT